MVSFCINTCSLGATPRGDLPLPEQLRAAASAGFGLVGLDIKTIEDHVENGGTIQGIQRLLDALDLQCWEIHVLRCMVPGESDAAHLTKARRIAHLAEELGAAWVNNTVHSANTPETIEHLNACADIMAAASTRLSIEFQPEYACGTAQDAHELVRALGRSDVGLQPDTWHLFRGSGAPNYLAQIPPNQFSFVQFGDGNANNAATDDRALPGAGTFDLDSFVRFVKATGYDGVVEIETFVSELMNGDPVTSAKTQLESTRSYWEAERHPLLGTTAQNVT